MANIFDRGNTWLNTRLTSGGSSDITLTVDGTTVTIRAVIGQELANVASLESADTKHSDREFSVMRSELVRLGLPSEPDRGWKIVFLSNAYEVFDWSDDDAFDGMVRMKTTRVFE